MNNIELKLVAENEELKLKYLESLSKNIELPQQNIDLLKQIGKYQLYEIAPMEKAKDVINELAKDYPKLNNSTNENARLQEFELDAHKIVNDIFNYLDDNILINKIYMFREVYADYLNKKEIVGEVTKKRFAGGLKEYAILNKYIYNTENKRINDNDVRTIFIFKDKNVKMLNHENLAKDLKISVTELSTFKSAYKLLFADKLPYCARRGVYNQKDYDFIKNEYLKFKGVTNE
jgi:hypothetical protein